VRARSRTNAGILHGVFHFLGNTRPSAHRSNLNVLIGYVRFGSKADILRRKGHVRCTLAFARNYELTKEAIDVPELVRGMKELLERSIGPSFNVETRFPLSLKPVAADANQLELALLNLTLNARDAMPDGGDIVLVAREENISASHSNGLEAGRYIRVSVTDAGEGMDQETLRRAAEPFFTTKEIGKGTGLGPSMVH